MKVMHVVGARPNFMKVAPLMKEMARHPNLFKQILVHTGQHYDYQMSEIFIDDLRLPPPDVYLGVGSGSHAQQTARIMETFEPVLLEHKPDWVVVVGDVNSTLACALTAVKLGVSVAHVEAGLRSYDRTMPEEYNRLLTDQISDLLFTPSRDADANLLREGISPERIHFVGNVMIDSLVRLLPQAERRHILTDLDLVDDHSHIGDESRSQTKPYLLVTLHRPSNVDDVEKLQEILWALKEVSRDLHVVFPVHPRTRLRMAELGYPGKCSDFPNLRLIEPLGYLDFLALEQGASLVLTDSGGIQEETTYLGVPCLTARQNTERPVTITHGTNLLVTSDRLAIVEATYKILNDPTPSPLAVRCPELWDGHTAKRIVDVLGRLKGE